ncbi:MAG: glutamine synthetase III [Spirochaetes bacterium]|nr:glutamine synthetase III [Spirochaetota bacterium]
MKKDHDYSVPLARMYGENRFDDRVMRERLPKTVYQELKAAQTGVRELSLQAAEVVADAMKDWAIERGATHFTHWFQPLTGRTAEKHDSFISPNSDGTVLMEFSGRELVKGESDASSFPSGGLRATFEARGYTAWDVTSPAFLKDDGSGVTLYIPTAFVSYNGDALDKKLPLLRSMEAVGREAARVLGALGDTGSRRVVSCVGAEQEYFLVEKELFGERLDLMLCGRTLFGASAPKGQELEDHYYGQIPDRAAGFMRELNHELWKLGVPAKTQHKEVAPNQFEIASVYSSANTAADANQLVMETLRKVAERHDLVALLHEKPFAGVNGSGKHVNWSLAADGANLFEPGADPFSNLRFLVFTAAVIEAVDRWAPLLRATVASAGNDLRLGANEAPPAIVSVYLGDQLTDIFERLCSGRVSGTDGCGELEMGASTFAKLPRDLSDRNRTSPFAFTGDKFEFRMPSSSESVSTPVAILNAAVADALSDFADRLEASKDPLADAVALVAASWREHRRVVFNGNGYSEEWLREAAQRGLSNLRTTPEALPELVSPEAVSMLGRRGVMSAAELGAVHQIELERYVKKLVIEAQIMIEMAHRWIAPAATETLGRLARTAESLTRAGSANPTISDLLVTVGSGLDRMAAHADDLERRVSTVRSRAEEEPQVQARQVHDVLVPSMAELRAAADALERVIPRELWPFPGYTELMYRI